MILESLRIIAGLILILFIPGYALTWAFYPRKQDIDYGERIALSFALSISGVMLSVLFVDLALGIDTTPINILLTILGLTFAAILTWRIHLYIINKEIKQRAIKAIFTFIKVCKERINKIRSARIYARP